MAQRRLHLLEIADQSWCPRILRDGLTDYLRQLEWVFRPYDPLLPQLRAALARCNEERVLDLCSGAGGPWVPLLSSWEKSGGGRSRCDSATNARAPGMGARGGDFARSDSPDS
jgi:hypothetical protein